MHALRRIRFRSWSNLVYSTDMMHKQSPSAFSLVELSIVLVILGLLTGGILGGQALIRAAELRSISADFSRHQTAVMSFRDKYFAMPGDMSNATSFWGAQDSGDGLGSDCLELTTPASGTLTCNGNGDGRIGAVGGACTVQAETYRAWQHLQNAGLVEGKLSGVPVSVVGGQCRQAAVGVNMMPSKIANAAFQMIYRTNSAVHLNDQDMNRISFGTIFVTGPDRYEAEGPAIRPEEAWNIDLKLDDGLPQIGNMRAPIASWFGTDCSNASGTAYNLSNAATHCFLSMRLGV